MNCQHFDDIVDLHAAGEADPATAAAAESHASDCPACRERLQAARRRLAALEAALGRHRASPGFVERAMARVGAEAQADAAGEEQREGTWGRVARYVAMAAAAALFVLAGRGFLRRQGPARLEQGVVAVAGPNARPLKASSPLAVGDVLATPTDRRASLVLAGGRLRVVLEPATVVRITDPPRGTAHEVLRGGAWCRASSARGAPAIASPLARVAASQGVVSVHVNPHRAAGASPTGRFQGEVTLVAHEGGARVLAGRQRGRKGALALKSGQVLTLRSPGRAEALRARPGAKQGRAFVVLRRPDAELPAGPVSVARLREAVERSLREVMTRHGELERARETVAARMRLGARPGEQLQLFRHAAELHEAMRQTEAIHAELGRRLAILRRSQP
jgi:hypothetical protein